MIDSSHLYSVIVEDAFGTVDDVKKHALRRCIINNEHLFHEFYTEHHFNSCHMSTDKFCEATEKFVEKKGLRIVEEKPYVTIDSKNRYTINVRFLITDEQLNEEL